MSTLSIGELVGFIDLDAGPAESTVGKFSGFLESAGGKWEKILAGAGVGAAVAFGAALMEGLDRDAQADKLAASLGGTSEDAKRYGKVAGEVFSNGFGAGMEDVNLALEAVVSSIKGMRNASDADLQDMTQRALTFADVMGIDVGRAAQVAGGMIQSGLAKDGEQAFDLLMAASQKVPAALREDVLDATEEYGQFFTQLGIDGPAAMGMLAKGAEKGMYGIDKAGDAVKEFTIRSTDMSTTSKDAYKAIGLDARTMANAILAGGDKARGATDKIIDGLLSIKDPAKRANASIALFGTPLEDLSTKDVPKFLRSLKSGQDGLGKFSGAVDKAGATAYDNANSNLTQFTRKLQTGFVNLIGGQVIPKVDSLAASLNTGLGPAFDVVGGAAKAAAGFLQEHPAIAMAIGAAIAAFLLPNLILMGIEATKSAAKSVAAWTMQQAAAARTVAGFVIAKAAVVAGWVMMGAKAMAQAARMAAAWIISMGPIAWVIAAVVGLAVLIFKNWDKIKAATGKVWSWVSNKVASAWKWIKTKVTEGARRVWDAVKDGWNKVKSTTSNLLGKVVSYVKDIPGRFKSGLSRLSSVLSTVFSVAMNKAKDKVTNIGGKVLDWIRGIPGKIMNLAGRFGTAGRNLLQRFIDGMKNAAGIISGIAGNVWNAVRGLLNGAISRINAALEFRINLPGKDLVVNIPDIPHLATGGRATSETLAVIGEGREPESVLPDSVLRGLLERAHAAGAASARGDRGRSAPLIDKVIQQPGESAESLAERLWFKTQTRG